MVIKLTIKKSKFIILILTIVIFFIISYIYKKQRNNTTNKILKKNEIVKKPTPTAAIKNPISNMFFSYQLESITKNEKLLTIYLKGSEDSLADAADFKLKFNESVKIKKIFDGDSFISYPRKKLENNYLLVTGISLDEKNNFKFAKPNTIFIKILIKLSDNKKNPSIFVDNSETRIFFGGKEITNLNNLFKEVKLDQ